MSHVELENVYKNYGESEDAVKGVSFECNDGEFLVLLGPSGCGKTTTLRMITGLESITSGIIKIGGKVINDMSPQERNVAMAFETYALYPPLTVRENIAFPLRVMKLSRKDIDRKVKEVAKALSITDILDELPGNLAGGQKQRISLARALVRNPTVFLMDEPLSHVDADVRYRARAEIKHMQATTKATVIYVTHDQVEAVALADRVIVMDLGVIQQIGTPLDLYYRPANLFVAGFIGEPPMNTVIVKLEFTEGKLLLNLEGDNRVTLHYDVTAGLPQDALTRLNAYHGREVVMGVRPQRVRIQPPAAKDTPKQIPGELLVHEFLGNDGIGQVSVNSTQFECVTPPDIPFVAGDPVSLEIDFADLHFFDKNSTQRIEYEVR
jgi:multiple sugar transport system ATP-binding protein